MLTQATVWTVLLAGTVPAAQALVGWARRRDPLDLSYAAATAPWLCLLAWGHWAAGAQAGVLPWLGPLAYQLSIAGVSAFWLVAARSWGGGVRLLLAAQLALGLVLMPWPDSPWPRVALQLWPWVNAGGMAAVVLAIARHTWRRFHPSDWMVLVVALCGLGVMLSGLRAHPGVPVAASLAQGCYLAALCLLWLALTRRVGAALPAEHAAGAERSQLAQDLHDGVGSQLASLISALDSGTPQQRATAATLQHCLVELKLLVDGAHVDGTVIGHLASLRYRMQPMLDAAGIRMHWHIGDEDQLARIGGDAARQVLRVAQEALANVVRHASASDVAVTCCIVKLTRTLTLEVADNGVGLPPALRGAPDSLDHRAPPGQGRGLAGMHERARRLGGQLHIDARHGQGTRVRLAVPVDALLDAAAADGAPPARPPLPDQAPAHWH